MLPMIRKVYINVNGIVWYYSTIDGGCCGYVLDAKLKAGEPGPLQGHGGL